MTRTMRNDKCGTFSWRSSGNVCRDVCNSPPEGLEALAIPDHRVTDRRFVVVGMTADPNQNVREAWCFKACGSCRDRTPPSLRTPCFAACQPSTEATHTDSV